MSQKTYTEISDLLVGAHTRDLYWRKSHDKGVIGGDGTLYTAKKGSMPVGRARWDGELSWCRFIKKGTLIMLAYHGNVVQTTVTHVFKKTMKLALPCKSKPDGWLMKSLYNDCWFELVPEQEPEPKVEQTATFPRPGPEEAVQLDILAVLYEGEQAAAKKQKEMAPEPEQEDPDSGLDEPDSDLEEEPDSVLEDEPEPQQLTVPEAPRPKPRRTLPIPAPRHRPAPTRLRIGSDIYGTTWVEFLSRKHNSYYWGNGTYVTWHMPIGWTPPLYSIYS